MAESYSSTNKLVNPDKPSAEEKSTTFIQSPCKDALVSWVMERVSDWEVYRDSEFLDRWHEYFRLWKGVWAPEDVTRQSERSRLIQPALQQAVESAVADLEEATFGRSLWFDLVDNEGDEDPSEVDTYRKRLIDDFRYAGVEDAVAEVYLNAALYGTGIGKIITEEKPYKEVISRQNADTGVRVDSVVKTQRVSVKLEPIRPEDFVIDTAVSRPGKEGIEQALGCAHIMLKPRITILDRMDEEDVDEIGNKIILDNGLYLNVPLKPWGKKGKSAISEEVSPNEDSVRIIEYFGRVPKNVFMAVQKELETDKNEENAYDEPDDEEYVEAIVTIANDEYLLRCVKNPFIMEDRPIIAFPFDSVPNTFWGRGVAEKGYNSQKALDAILRAQLDGLALTVHPMMAVDGTAVPRGEKFTITPGKTVVVNGNPANILMPFRFGGIDTTTYSAAADLERMIQMSTGQMDSASPLRMNARNTTASGMSMILQGVMKRSKRTLQNIERHFLTPLIQKSLWRFMQFDPIRYKAKDFDFRVYSSLGIMAREVEQQQLINLLQFVPPQSPVFWALVNGVIDNSSIVNKELIKQTLAQQLQPDPKQQQLQELSQQLGIDSQVAKTEEVRARSAKNIAQAQKLSGEATKVQHDMSAAALKQIETSLDQATPMEE